MRAVSLKMNSNVYSLKNTNSHYLLLNTTTIPLCSAEISLTFCEGKLSNILPCLLRMLYSVFTDLVIGLHIVLEEQGVGFFYILIGQNLLRVIKLICWWSLTYLTYFFINKVWTSLLIFNVPQHISRSKERTSTRLWKSQKIAFSLRLY